MHLSLNWDGPSRMRSLLSLLTQIIRYNRRSFTRPSLFLVRWCGQLLPASWLTISHRASQGHYTYSQDSITAFFTSAAQCRVVGAAREEPLKYVDCMQLVYDNTLDSEGDLHKRGNYDELFTALRLVHDM